MAAPTRLVRCWASLPLVRRLISNPVREGAAGWDDSANRQALLDAAVGAGASWAVFLDSDERLDTADANTLGTFLRTDALPGCAYELRLFRMWGRGRCVADPTWVYRARAPESGQALPARTLT